jgi:hypothetical protein
LPGYYQPKKGTSHHILISGSSALHHQFLPLHQQYIILKSLSNWNISINLLMRYCQYAKTYYIPVGQ